MASASSNDDDMPWQRNPARCRLCRYPLELGDLFVDAASPHKPPQPFGFYEFRLGKVHEQQREFCGREQVWPDLARFHADCHAFALTRAPASFACVHATRYDLVAPLSEDVRRRRRTQHVLAQRLQTVVLPDARLPLEVWMLVAAHLVRECAIVQMEALWDQAGRLRRGGGSTGHPEPQQKEEGETAAAATTAATAAATTPLRSKLVQGWMAKLPLDKRPDVAVRLPLRRKESAAVPPPRAKRKKKEIRPSRGVWAYYTCIDGVRYVAKLTSNKPKQAWATHMADPGADAARTKTMVHILYDHVGVRQVVFADPRSTALRDKLEAYYGGSGSSLVGAPGWWKSMSTLEFKTIKVVSDGLKIVPSSETTSISHYKNGIATDVTSNALNTSWTMPMTGGASDADADAVHMFSFGITRGMYSRCIDLRMASVPCNSPDIVGYSILYAGSNLCTLLAHRGDAEATRVPAAFYGSHSGGGGGGDGDRRAPPCWPPSFDEWYPPWGVWVHFPLDPGEHIAHILSRRGPHSMYMALVWLTSRGRPLVMAPALARHPPQRDNNNNDDDDDGDAMVDVIKYCRLPVGRPTHLYYNISTRGVRQIGVRHAHDTDTPDVYPRFALEPPSPSPALRLPRTSLRDRRHAPDPDAAPRLPHYFYSAADLQGAVRVIPYRGPRRRADDGDMGDLGDRGDRGGLAPPPPPPPPAQIAGLMIEYGGDHGGEPAPPTPTPAAATNGRGTRPRRACLGECRLDRAEPALEVQGSGSKALHLGFVEASGSGGGGWGSSLQPYVARVEIDDAVVEEDKQQQQQQHPLLPGGPSLFWLDIPWQGRPGDEDDGGTKVEWWFTYGHCKVVSAQGESPSFHVATEEDV